VTFQKDYPTPLIQHYAENKISKLLLKDIPKVFFLQDSKFLCKYIHRHYIRFAPTEFLR
jgi:hypothetical protein